MPHHEAKRAVGIAFTVKQAVWGDLGRGRSPDAHEVSACFWGIFGPPWGSVIEGYKRQVWMRQLSFYVFRGTAFDAQ